MINIKVANRAVIFSALFISFAFLQFFIPKVNAANGADFQAGRIIDDAVFVNNQSMTVQQIQAFLDAKVPVCDRWRPSSNPSYQPPWTCLKEYQENPITGENNLGPEGRGSNGEPRQVTGGKTAAQYIWEAAQTYNINPQVILVTLQKEQSLITDDWPWAIQYWRAMGNRCPDGPGGAQCDPNYAGFANQIDGGTWQFRHDFNGIGTPGFWAPYYRGWNNILYQDPNTNASCGTKPVFIENQATAVLYKYTPYTPNQAALNNLYGTGDSCSSYGNRNFWRLFTDWFGSTTGPDYAWSIESYTYSGGDNILSQGFQETITLKAKNIGRATWYNHGAWPTRLGTWQPANRQSYLFPSRLATMQENSAAYGEIATFTFQVTPGQQGTFIESLNLVAENATWMAWPGFSPTIQVTSPYQWQIQNIIYEKGTGAMDPGTKQLVTVIAKNTGNVTWSKTSGPSIRLGTWLPDRQTRLLPDGWISPTRVTSMNENEVAPGQNAGFQFYVTVPASGYFYEQFNLVAEGQAWFNNPGLTLYLYGKKYSWEPVWHTLSTPSAEIPKNTSFTVTFKAKNNGEVTWRKDSGYQIRLATSNPKNRGSGIYDSSWINPIRTATLVEDVVAPGEIGTFIFTAKTPNVVGERFEGFSLIAEGVTWFNDPGYQIYVKVLP